jgi:hypothetical protein
LAAGAISEYPGAAGPVSGWVLPIVTVVAVTPGAEAVFAVEVELPQAAASIAAAPPTAATAQVLDLLISGRMRVLLVGVGADS